MCGKAIGQVIAGSAAELHLRVSLSGDDPEAVVLSCSDNAPEGGCGHWWASTRQQNLLVGTRTRQHAVEYGVQLQESKSSGKGAQPPI
jgi:hypothetical protein